MKERSDLYVKYKSGTKLGSSFTYSNTIMLDFHKRKLTQIYEQSISICNKKLLPSRIELLTLGYPTLKLGHRVYETYVRFNIGDDRGCSM